MLRNRIKFRNRRKKVSPRILQQYKTILRTRIARVETNAKVFWKFRNRKPEFSKHDTGISIAKQKNQLWHLWKSAFLLQSTAASKQGYSSERKQNEQNILALKASTKVTHYQLFKQNKRREELFTWIPRSKGLHSSMSESILLTKMTTYCLNASNSGTSSESHL